VTALPSRALGCPHSDANLGSGAAVPRAPGSSPRAGTREENALSLRSQAAWFGAKLSPDAVKVAEVPPFSDKQKVVIPSSWF